MIGGLVAKITVAIKIIDRLSQVHEALAKEAKSNPKAVVARFEEVRGIRNHGYGRREIG